MDNFETIVDEDIKSFIIESLPRNLSVLITASGRLDLKVKYRMPLDELGKEDALLLFKERLTRDGLEQESEPDLERLYQVVGGNPLGYAGFRHEKV